MLLHESLELNCLRKFGSMKAADLCGLFKVSFYQEISVFAQQKSGEREWKENMKELQIMLTQKSQVKNYYDVLKALPPTSISISSLTFKPIKHMNTEGKMVCAKPTECLLTANTDSCRHSSAAADTLPHNCCCSYCTKIHAARTSSVNLFHIFPGSSWGWFLTER